MGSNPKRLQTWAQERDYLSWVRGTHQFGGEIPTIGEKEGREQWAGVQTTLMMETLGAGTWRLQGWEQPMLPAQLIYQEAC